MIGFFFLLGAAVGSFLNVVIYRLPRGMSLIHPGSHCPVCGAPIRFYDNIPILSYVILRGRCRNCGARISPRYFWVELLTALFFVAAYLRFGLGWTLVEAWVLISYLLAVSLIDLEFRLIPDRLTFPAIGLGFVLSYFGGNPGFLQSLLGALIGGGLMLFFAWMGEKLFGREALGGGDIKMVAAVGAFLGPWKVLMVPFLGAFLAILAVVVLRPQGELRGLLLPFGPALALAALVMLFAGDALLRIWLGIGG